MADTKKIELAVPIVAYLFPDPFTAYKWGVELDVLPHIVVLTEGDSEGAIRESAWTYNPGVEFFFEVPMGNWSAQINAGASIPLQVEGVTDTDVDSSVGGGQFGLAAKINWRLGR